MSNPAPEQAAALSLTALADRILATHHEFTRDAFDRLLPLAEKVATVHATHPEAVDARDTLADLADDLLAHLAREEQILFPYIRMLDEPAPPAAPFGTIANPLRVMAADHTRATELLAALRRITGNYVVPEHACRSWRALWEGLAALDADLVAHIQVEDEQLFPRALERERQLRAR